MWGGFSERERYEDEKQYCEHEYTNIATITSLTATEGVEQHTMARSQVGSLQQSVILIRVVAFPDHVLP